MINAPTVENAGGIDIAQVKCLAEIGSIPSKPVLVPGPFVDCVVVVNESDHGTVHSVSFVERDHPITTGETRASQDRIQSMNLSIRKIIARQSSYSSNPVLLSTLALV